MRTLVFWISMLALSTPLWAQGEQPDCVKCWATTDFTCDAQTTCANWNGAEGQTFVAPCNGTYRYECKTVCEDPLDCHVCITCSRLTDVTTGSEVLTCNTVTDPAVGCESGCHYSHTVDLIAGHEYKLEVALQKCRDIQFCSLCECTAQARVYHATAYCPAW